MSISANRSTCLAFESIGKQSIMGEAVQQYLEDQLRDLAESSPKIPVTNAIAQTLFHTWARIGEAEHHRSCRDDFRYSEVFIWRRVPDLFAGAIPIRIFLANAGGPLHQWRMTREDWLACFRQFPPSKTRPPGPVTSLELAKLKDAGALKFIVRGYLLRKMSAYQLNFTRLAQSWIVRSPAVRASGLHIADVCEEKATRVPEPSFHYQRCQNPGDNNPVRTSLQMRLYCVTPGYGNEWSPDSDSWQRVGSDFWLEYNCPGGKMEFQTDVKLGYCESAKNTGGVRRVVVHRAVFAEEYVRFEYCLNDKVKAEEFEKEEFRMKNQQEAERVAAGINAAIAIWQDGDDSLHEELVRQSPREKFDEVREMMLCGPINMLCTTVWGRNSLTGCNELWGGNGGESQRVGSRRKRVPFPGTASALIRTP